MQSTGLPRLLPHVVLKYLLDVFILVCMPSMDDLQSSLHPLCELRPELLNGRRFTLVIRLESG